MSTRIVLTYGDVTTDVRTSEALSIEGIETLARITYDQHVRALVTVEQLEQTP